jgi:hypothetical protein
VDRRPPGHADSVVGSVTGLRAGCRRSWRDKVKRLRHGFPHSHSAQAARVEVHHPHADDRRPRGTAGLLAVLAVAATVVRIASVKSAAVALLGSSFEAAVNKGACDECYRRRIPHNVKIQPARQSGLSALFVHAARVSR